MNRHIAPGGRVNNAPRSGGLVACLQALSTALRYAGAEPLNQDTVRRLVRAVCAAARRERVLPEHLIIELKHMIGESMPRGQIPRDRHEAVGADLIRYTIESYFENSE
jgi:hypothetical protein